VQIGGGSLVVSRSQDGNRDRFRRYTVLVDGAEIGRLKRGETVTTDLAPGVHTLTITIDWTKSEITFDVHERGGACFIIGPAGRARDGERDLASGAQWVSIVRTETP
jgi:hypothetical protein